MIQYIYFVKCPNCADEPFDFLDDAKAFAFGCLHNKPIITQTEINRNDFGECTDSCDLGQIWSWEDETAIADDEQVPNVLTKGHLGSYNSDDDPEFTELDNSVDVDTHIVHVSDAGTETAFNTDDALDHVPDNFRKPVPDGMTIDQLVEEMEENEDDVECKGCHELFDKSECVYDNDYHGWLCYACQVGIEQHDGDNLYPEDSDRYEDSDGMIRRPVTDEMRKCAAELANLLNAGTISTAEEIQAVLQKYDLE